jgi:hypothetical protein
MHIEWIFHSMTTSSIPNDDLHGKVLLWAYERGAQGFTWSEMEKELGLTKDQIKWVQHVLHFGAIDVEKWFDRIRQHKNWDPVANTQNERFYIAPRGTSEATQYRRLRELEKSSSRAQWTAIASIVIGALVGVAQIIAAFVGNT